MSNLKEQQANQAIHGKQHGAEFNHEKMDRRYGSDVEHKHNKDHHLVREHEKSHPHIQHGGEPEGHKHPQQTHQDRHEHGEHRHHKTKQHDHKEHSREHHKTAHNM